MAEPDPGRPGPGRMGCQAEKGQRRPPAKKQQQEVAGSPKNLPFLGKSFYLDLPNNKNVQFLGVTIKQLGGVIESFLSKEVSYVVSSSKEAKLGSGPGRQTEKRTSTASGDAKAKTLPAAVPKGSHAGLPHKPADSALISRGKELLQKAIRNQDSSSGSILANARSWGVRILNVDEMMAYVQQLLLSMSGARKLSEMTTVKCFSAGPGVHKVGKLKPPFLKIEDQSRRFRPFHHQFKSFPDLNFLTPNGSSPFEPPKSPSSSCRVRVPEGCLTHSEREQSPRSSPATVPRRRKGFCECCQETFEELQTHLQSPRHRRFALDASQYAAVDHVIAQLTNDFAVLPAWSSPPRAPCSAAADDQHGDSRAKAVEGVGVPAAELGRKQQLAMKDYTELRPTAAAGLGLPGGQCSTCPEEMPKESSELPPAAELPAGLLLGLQARPSAGTGRAWWQHADRSAFNHGAGGAAAPGHSQGSRASPGGAGAAACSPELGQEAREPPGASPRSRKRRRSCSSSAQQEKKPRILLSSDPLCLEKPPGSMRCGSVQQGVGLPAGGVVGTAPSGAPGAELLLPSRLCSPPASVTPQDRAQVLPAPPVPVPLAIAHPQAAQANAATRQGWARGTPCLQEGRPTAKVSEPACCVAGSGRELHSPAWDKATCSAVQRPLPVLPVPGARRCCCFPSLCCTGADEGALPKPSHTTALGLSLAPHPSILQPGPSSTPAGPNLDSSSESDWDIQLLPALGTLQGPRHRPGDLAVLRRTCINIRDSGYQSHLYSVLKPKSELDWAGREDESWQKCCTETEGAPLPSWRPSGAAGTASP
ncbi:protein DBF4 homolog B isoform X2 [Emydura macquarii macquarii]|uniref:protein DBF4 homolog B isoform X2 n=1 Tax=Emydura macquarii macquarii TaxID=1129001 RepID=UPI00352B5A7A